jgi:hypothetical protein
VAAGASRPPPEEGALPLNVALSPGGRYAAVTNNGINKPTPTVIDVASWTVQNTTVIDNAWYGLVWHPNGTRPYSSSAASNSVQELAFADGVVTKLRTFALPAASGETFVGGLAISRDGRTLFATRVFAMTLSAIDVASGAGTKTRRESTICPRRTRRGGECCQVVAQSCLSPLVPPQRPGSFPRHSSARAPRRKFSMA